MLTDSVSKLEHVRDDSVEVTLSVGGDCYNFKLSRDECRAIAVGSRASADLRFDCPGVAPVHFHIERDDHRVWIVPAYGVSDIRVNAARITGPKVIYSEAIIEFSNVRVRALVIDYGSGAAPDSSSDTDTLGWNISTTGLGMSETAAPEFAPIIPSNDAMSKTLPLGAAVAPFPLLGEATLFDPITAPVQTSELSLATQSLVVARHGTAKTPVAYLRQIGLLSQRRRRLVWLWGAALIIVVFALVSSASRHTRRTERLQAQATDATGGAVRNLPPAIGTAPHQGRSTPTLEVVPSGPDSHAQVENEAPAVNRELFAATDHLIAGHYADAQREYANLATQPWADPAVIEISRLLTEKLGSRCAGEASNPVLSCPEIRQ